MKDINAEAEKALSGLDCSVVYLHPGQFTKFPAVSYYNVTEMSGFCADNEESVQSGYVQVDVWTRKPKECGDLAVRVNEAMTAAGWTRGFSRDIPEQAERVFHKTMRFHKYFTL